MSVRNRNTGDAIKLATLLLLAAIAGASLIRQAVHSDPIALAGMTVDRLSAVLTLLVAGVGAVTFRFSLRYLDGDPGKGRFLNVLFASVCAAYLLMLSTNLVLLFTAWFLTSIGLHKLLTFYPDRPQAIPAARKKFLISRLGDLALIAAIGVIWRGWHTTDLHSFLAQVTPGSAEASVVAVLIAVAALTKSAQFPFHSWLPETMESPTPVSALMHAGIINAGGALLIRFAPLVAASPAALVLLTLIGTLTAALGMVSMWAQVKVKRTLAWSTVSQMGFMMIQSGLGVFPAALLHIVGHGLYKAWSFLRAGSLPAPTTRNSRLSAQGTLSLAACGTLAALPALYLASRVTGFDPMHAPGELALSAVIALSVGQVWVALFRGPPGDGGSVGSRILGAIGLTVAISLTAFALYRGAQIFLGPVLGPIAAPSGPSAWVLAGVPVVTLFALIVIHAFLPEFVLGASGRAFYVHALHGFYFGAIADRLVERLWSHPARKEVVDACRD